MNESGAEKNNKKVMVCFKRAAAANADIILFAVILFIKSLKLLEGINLKYNLSVFPFACIGSIAVLLSCTIWLKRKTRMVYLFAMDAIVSFIMVADMVYFRYFNDVLSTPVFSQIGVVDSSLKNSIASLINFSDLYFVIDIIVLIPVSVILSKVFGVRERRSIKSRAISAAAALAVGILLIVFSFARVNGMMFNQAFKTVFDHGFVISNLGILNYHGFDTYFYLSNEYSSKKSIDESEKESIKNAVLKNNEKSGNAGLFGSEKGKNLIIVQVEAMQNLVIGLKINGKEVTPNLNKLIERSIYFNHYYSQIGQGNTSDAEFVTNNSLQPLPEGSAYFRCVGNTFQSLPMVLKAEGYATVAMHAYKASYWNRATFYPKEGFERFVSAKDFRNDEAIGWGLSDNSFLKQSVDIIKGYDKPFYAFLVTLSSHYPYDYFETYSEFDAGDYNGTFFGKYLKAMHYADKSIGSFVRYLEQTGLLDSSILAIYGDHEGLKTGDLNEAREFAGLSANDDIASVQLKNIPLIIHLPGDKEKGTRAASGGQMDLYPTLANLLGVKPDYCLGTDLLNSDRGFVALRSGNVTDGKTIYLKKDSKYYDMHTGKQIEDESFRRFIPQAERQLYISDCITENDLLKDFMKK